MDLSVAEVLIRLGISFLFGALIGVEREMKKYRAGLRTHILVCLGSSLLVLISLDFMESNERGSKLLTEATPRIMAGVITGIGFLGAGTIIKHGNIVRGLTTAASIWVASAIGLAVGAGAYLPAAAALILTLFTLSIINWVDAWLDRFVTTGVLMIRARDDGEIKGKIFQVLSELGVETASLSSRRSSQNIDEIELVLLSLPKSKRKEVFKRIAAIEGILQAEWA